MPQSRSDGQTLAVPSEDLLALWDQRFVEEDPPKARSEAERDRDRVLYSSAFLRLGHVTQVAAPEVGHTFHSRLTHSLKVAQVARGLCQELRRRSTLGNSRRPPPGWSERSTHTPRKQPRLHTIWAILRSAI